MKITFIRHGAVEEKYIGKYNGHIDISLGNDGVLQMREVAKKISNISFDAVFCSDLKRAKESCKLLNLDITPQYTKALREKSWGEHEGMSFAEICKTGLKYESFEQWIENLRGESIVEFKKRVFDFFKYIYTLKYKHILIVTHSGVIKTFISNIENISLEKAFSTQVPYGFIKTYDIITE